jgi:hypothetical protein
MISKRDWAAPAARGGRWEVGRVLARCLLVVGVATGASAQVSAGRSVVQGVVVDSVGARRLPGATVQLARRDAMGAVRRVSTDTAGRYAFADVPPGEYVVGFDHDALTALGLDTPVRALSVGAADTLVTADLAIPSSAVVRALRCGAGLRADRGLLLGTLREATSGAVVPGATLSLYWGALALDSGPARLVTERATATIEPDGTYLVCGLPRGVPLTLGVTAPGHHAVGGPVVEVPDHGLGRLDVRLVDSAVARGTAVIRGAVRHASGTVVAAGRVVVQGLAREVPVREGAFVLGELPAGSWVIETRVLGTAPQARLVTVDAAAPAEVLLRVAATAQLLDAVTVVGAMDRDTRVLQEVLARRRHYGGTFFLPGSDAMKFAHLTSDLMKEARGFRWISPTKISGCVALFVDDSYQPAALELLDVIAPLKDVLAVETYPNIALAPIQYRHAFGCINPRRPDQAIPPSKVVVVWMKRRF